MELDEFPELPGSGVCYRLLLLAIEALGPLMLARGGALVSGARDDPASSERSAGHDTQIVGADADDVARMELAAVP